MVAARVQYAQDNAWQSATLSGTITFPAAPTVGNLLVVSITIHDSGARVFVTPSGWTQGPINATNQYITAFYKISDGSETVTNWSWDVAGSMAMQGVEWSGFDLTTVSGTSGTGNGVLSAVMTSTAAAGDLTMFVLGHRNAVASTWPGTVTVGDVSASANTRMTDAYSLASTASQSATPTWGTTDKVGWYTLSFSPIASGTTVVGVSEQVVWDIDASVGSDEQTVWDVNSLIGADEQTVWDLNSTVGADEQAVWDIGVIGGIARVQAATAGAVASASGTVVLASDPIVGNLLIADVVLVGSALGTVTAPSGWTSGPTSILVGSGGATVTVETWYRSSVGAADKSTTWSHTFATNDGYTVTEYSNVNTAIIRTNSGGATNSAITLTSTALAGDLIHFASGWYAYNPPYTWTGDGAAGSDSGIVGGYAASIDAYDLVATANGSAIITGAAASYVAWVTLSFPLALATVGADEQTVWDLNATTGSDEQTVWDLNAVTGSNEQTVWDLNSIIGSNEQTVWDVLTLALTVGADEQAVWNIGGPIGASEQTVWDILAAIGSSEQTVWDLNAITGADEQAVWDVAVVGPPLTSDIHLGGIVMRYSTLSLVIVTRADEVDWSAASATSPAYPTSGTVGYMGLESALTVIDGPSNVPAGTIWNSTYNYLDIRTDSFTLDGVYVKGGIDYYGATRLTVKNSIVEGGWGGSFTVEAQDYGGALDISDSTLRWKAGSPAPGSGNSVIQISGYHPSSTIMRCDISGSPDGIRISGDTWIVQQCYIHDLTMGGTYPNSTHNDGIHMLDGAGHKVISNNISIGAVAPYSNSAIYIPGPGVGSIEVRGNYLDGGGYTMYAKDGSIASIDNTFGPNYLYTMVLFSGATASMWVNNIDFNGILIPSP